MSLREEGVLLAIEGKTSLEEVPRRATMKRNRPRHSRRWESRPRDGRFTSPARPPRWNFRLRTGPDAPAAPR